MVKKISSEETLAELLKGLDMDGVATKDADDCFDMSKAIIHKEPLGKSKILAEIPAPMWAHRMQMRLHRLDEFIDAEKPRMATVEVEALQEYKRALRGMMWARLDYELPLDLKVIRTKAGSAHLHGEDCNENNASCTGTTDGIMIPGRQVYRIEEDSKMSGAVIGGSGLKGLLEALKQIRKDIE